MDLDRSIATAESCTGAMLASVLTDVKGSSGVFERGFVADEGDEPGLVHLACARRGRPTVHLEEHFGPIGRGPVRVESIRVALNMMDEVL